MKRRRVIIIGRAREKGSAQHLEKRITVNAQTLKILKKKIQKVKYTKVNGKQSEKRKLDVQSEYDDQKRCENVLV